MTIYRILSFLSNILQYCILIIEICLCVLCIIMYVYRKAMLYIINQFSTMVYVHVCLLGRNFDRHCVGADSILFLLHQLFQIDLSYFIFFSFFALILKWESNDKNNQLKVRNFYFLHFLDNFNAL